MWLDNTWFMVHRVFNQKGGMHLSIMYVCAHVIKFFFLEDWYHFLCPLFYFPYTTIFSSWLSHSSWTKWPFKLSMGNLRFFLKVVRATFPFFLQHWCYCLVFFIIISSNYLGSLHNNLYEIWETFQKQQRQLFFFLIRQRNW